VEVPELDCRYCENLDHVYEEFPSPEEPVVVRNYYLCRAGVFEAAFTADELRRYYARCPARAVLTRSRLVDELLSEVDTINVVFSQLLGERRVAVIRVDHHLAAGLATPCTSQFDFFTKIALLYNILDFDRESLRRLLKATKPDPQWKGVTLLKHLLAEYGQYNQPEREAIAFFERVIAVRDKTYPAHRYAPEEVARILREIGLRYPVSSTRDWQENWDAVLRRFTESLRSVRKALTSLAKATAG